MPQTITVLRSETVQYWGEVTLTELARITGLDEARVLAIAEAEAALDLDSIPTKAIATLYDLTVQGELAEVEFHFISDTDKEN